MTTLLISIIVIFILILGLNITAFVNSKDSKPKVYIGFSIFGTVLFFYLALMIVAKYKSMLVTVTNIQNIERLSSHETPNNTGTKS